ncbi:MAG: hypothetical protein V3V59_05130 [Thermodesulfovibrionales bacterium]
MNILYLLKLEPDKTLSDIIEQHKKENEVQIVDIRKEKNYAQIVDLIAECDKVISW